MSPTISSITSSRVTIPAWPPYSSRTTAIWNPSPSRRRASSGSRRMVSGTTIGLTMMCLMRVVARSGTGSATACLTWTVPTTASSASSTGKREWPDCRARSMTWVARSPSSTLTVRTRGVMISPAVRVPNSTDRSISSAVSVSSVPCSADRCASDASSAELLADRSSSCGSSPRRRTSALAEPLSSRIGTRFTDVKVRWTSWVARATCMGRAIARFFGTSSPKIIVSPALRVSAIVTETTRTAPLGVPGPRAARRSARRSPARRDSRWPGW